MRGVYTPNIGNEIKSAVDELRNALDVPSLRKVLKTMVYLTFTLLAALTMSLGSLWRNANHSSDSSGSFISELL